jgi:hypothetical protein
MKKSQLIANGEKQMNTPLKHVIIPRFHPFKSAWQVARLTELLLMGHSWRQVQNFMAISKPEFDQLLDAAVDKAIAEQEAAEAEFAGS